MNKIEKEKRKLARYKNKRVELLDMQDEMTPHEFVESLTNLENRIHKTEENTAENDIQNASTEKENEKEETATENNSETDAYNEEGTETNTDGAEAVPPEESEQE